MYERVKLKFVRGLEVEFADRDRALRQVEEFAERGTRFPVIIYGPEGCGKTALLKQAKTILEYYGYDVIYVSPLAEDLREALQYTPSIEDLIKEALRLVPEPYSSLASVALKAASLIMRKFKRKIAILLDDLFQAVGLDKAERYTKVLLNLIEYPPGDYENIVILVSSSEGVTQEKIGRHRWAGMYTMWNICKEGFRQLYNKLLGEKPEFEQVWKLTGGNPWILAALAERAWNVDLVINELIRARGIDRMILELNVNEVEILREALDDPDIIARRLKEEVTRNLERKLIEHNLIMFIGLRDEHLWIDIPPPERDPELGIGRFYAWQTPLHREAVRKLLEKLRA